MDAARRVTSLTTDSRTFSLGYDDDGRRSTLTYPNNTSTSYTYDNNSNLTRLLHTGPGGTTIADINYTYDNVNNRLSKADVTTSSHDPSGTDAMSFDAANQLLNLNTTTYSYDLNGNRIQKTETGGITTYTYDEENRLTRVEISGTPAQVITYAYDPFGRRIQKNVNGTITNYVYDRDAIILQYDQSGAVTARYTHGLGIDEPLAMDNNSQIYYYHADGLGSIVALTSASGSVAQRYDYDAYGNITSPAPTVTQPYTYTAREYDPETGLYFYRARYYDPRVGRFLTRDPIGFAGGDVNLYGYVKNNSIRFRDPYGLVDYLDQQYPPSPGFTECIKDTNNASAAAQAKAGGNYDNCIKNCNDNSDKLGCPVNNLGKFLLNAQCKASCLAIYVKDVALIGASGFLNWQSCFSLYQDYYGGGKEKDYRHTHGNLLFQR